MKDNSTKIERIEETIKKVEFVDRWRDVNKLPFEEVIKHLNDYLDLLEGRRNEF